MSRTTVFRFVVVLSLLVVAVIGVAGIVSGQSSSETVQLAFDIAEDPTRFVYDETPLHEDGVPTYGNEFISQGYLYPQGTLNGSNGVLENGEPEFPDLVIGEWTCRGWHVGDGGHTVEGYWVVTTQTFRLNEDYDNAIIITDGFETPELNTTVARAIIGGTGQFSSASGEQIQELLGLTEFFSVNLRVQLNVTK